LEDFTYPDGKEAQLFVLDGTIPVSFRGETYNIPVCVLLQESHPYVPPLVYVRPTISMAIKPSPYVDTNGKVYHPYIHQWNYKSSYIASLLHILSGVFSERPPVYAKSESQATHSRPVTQQAEQARSNSTPPKPEVQPQDTQTDCIVCMDSKSNTVLLPCGHLGVCIECANALKTSTQTCPVCRQKIVSVQRVYQP